MFLDLSSGACMRGAPVLTGPLSEKLFLQCSVQKERSSVLCEIEFMQLRCLHPSIPGAVCCAFTFDCVFDWLWYCQCLRLCPGRMEAEEILVMIAFENCGITGGDFLLVNTRTIPGIICIGLWNLIGCNL